MNTESHPAKDRVIDFLLAEYAQLNDERRRQREAGLNRLNFFITLTSSVIAGLVAISGFGSISHLQIRLIALGALLFLVVVGWGTFLFSIARDISADNDLRAMARIRRYFIDLDSSIDKYLTWQNHDEPTRYVGSKTQSNIRLVTQLILSILFALAAGTTVSLVANNLLLSVGLGLICLPVTFFLLGNYARRKLQTAQEKARSMIRFPAQKLH